MTDSANYNLDSPSAPGATPPGGEPAVRVFVRTKGGRVQSIKDHDVPFPVTSPVALDLNTEAALTYEVAAGDTAIDVDDPGLSIDVDGGLTVDVDAGQLTIDVEVDLNC